jgi:peptide/nickel transport system substrate-binding protein
MRRAQKVMGGLTAMAAGALLLAACGGGTSPSKTKTSSSSSSSSAAASGSTTSVPSSKIKQGGTATFAEAASSPPNFIFPVTPTAYCSVYNISQFSNFLYRPLIWAGIGEHTGVNPKKSLFSSIKYSDHDTTVTVSLKPYKWSDGAPVSARDLTFMMNLVKANKTQWCQYTPGEMPDNVKSYQASGPRTVVFHLTGPVSPLWFTDNELGVLYPLPQQAWDKTSASGKVGNYDTTASGAKAVWNFLVNQAKDEKTFATNPLWKVVDGPWLLKSFDTTGRAVFVPNPKYSGPDKAHLSQFIEVPFTSDSSEFDVLRAGTQIDVGYLPPQDWTARSSLSSLGFKMTPWIILGVNYMIPNLTNPQVGPILDQLYVRQALQHLIPQQQIISRIFHGQAVPTYGPVPLLPKSNLVSSFERTNPYPFSVSAAMKLLKDHGWKVTPGGTDTCQDPGTGASQCGAKIAKGAKLSFTLLYSSGLTSLTQQSEAIKSAASQAGVTINLTAQPFNTVISTVNPCPKACNWELGEYGGISYGTLPTGDGLFLKGASLNAGSYNNPTAAKLIEGTLHSANSQQAFFKYEDFLAKDLPWIWVPTPYYQLTEVKKGLQGVVPQNAYTSLSPEDWYYTK